MVIVSHIDSTLLHYSIRGKMFIQAVSDPPGILLDFYASISTHAKIFRKNIRQLNIAVSLASQQVTEVRPSGNSWAPMVTIQGKLYHCIGNIATETGEIPKFGQIYVYGPAHQNEESDIRLAHMRLPRSTSSETTGILKNMPRTAQTLPRANNPYIKNLLTAAEVCRSETRNLKFVLNADAQPRTAQARSYNLPTGSVLREISVLIDEDPANRDIGLNFWGGGLQTIHDTHRAYDALHFVLLFPYGTDGRHLHIKQVGSDRRVSPIQFYSHILMHRSGRSNYILKAQKLFQEYCCMAYAKEESQRLRYIRSNQQDLRADLYHNVCDAITAADSSETELRLGKRVILLPSFTGGPRDIHRRYQDAMAAVRVFGKPDLFITFTCNPNWTEIVTSLLPGQTPSDRPDIVLRVFKLKVEHLIQDLSKKEIFGRIVSYMYTVEIQKRGLPHVHLLLILHPSSQLRDAEKVDMAVCAEIPSPESPLHAIITKHMIQSKCGEHNLCAPCMREGKCSKKYPKNFREETVYNDNTTYPEYRRRSPSDGGYVYVDRTGSVDNKWVVPYNAYLSMRFKANINVEVCGSVQGVKYLFKYVYKGHDRTMMHVEESQFDEVSPYEDYRVIGASEACWRNFDFPISGRVPAVMALPIHLPKHQMVFFESHNAESVINDPEPITLLMAWFETNLLCGNDRAVRTILYSYFPQSYTWNSQSRKWKKGAVDNVFLRSGGYTLFILPLGTAFI